jgi:hypothetical protein
LRCFGLPSWNGPQDSLLVADDSLSSELWLTRQRSIGTLK